MCVCVCVWMEYGIFAWAECVSGLVYVVGHGCMGGLEYMHVGGICCVCVCVCVWMVYGVYRWSMVYLWMEYPVCVDWIWSVDQL